MDAGCSIVITSLNGEKRIEREITETTPFTLLEKELKRNLIQLTATRLKVSAEMLEASDTCKLLWHELSSANLRGMFCLDSMSDEAYDKVGARMQDVHRRTNHQFPETCGICFGPCEDADSGFTVSSRLGNCVRCVPCFRCPLCRVYIDGQPVCYSCVDWRKDTLVEVPDDKLQRIRFLKGCTDSDDNSQV